MDILRIGLVADPAQPTRLAHHYSDRVTDDDDQPHRRVEVVSEPFTLSSEDVGTALSRLDDVARDRGWDLVVGLTDLPLQDDDGRYLVTEGAGHRRAAVLSLPALGGIAVRRRTVHALADLIDRMAASDRDAPGAALPRRGSRARLLLGMVSANRPWRLVPGLKSALIAALTTGAIATINSTVWLLADSLSWWRLVVATVVSLALIVGWLVVDGELWDRPATDSAADRERSHLYNASTLLTLTAGVLICYLALYLLNLLWALFVLDPSVMGGYLGRSLGHGDLFVLAWFVASAATVGGALGSGLESDDAIRAAAYAKREEERRSRLADDRS
jgi:hypothetical protein